MKCGISSELARVWITAYYMEVEESAKKKMHDNYPLLRTCLSGKQKHVNRRDNHHA
jgi:hypothetical protein